LNLGSLHCIDLDLPALVGFRKFLSAWLYHSAELTFLVDPGPLSTIPVVSAELRRHGVGRLDYILLTHIHIDHAGGTGALLEMFPEAMVVSHPAGMRHMSAPEKLWQGSVQVLGKEMTDAYGEIVRIPETNILAAEDDGAIGACDLRSYFTPGHAAHHCCYRLDNLLFGGEVTGVHCAVPSGIYMRPATPPRFILEVALDSIDRMIALQPEQLIIAHHGLVSPALDYLQIGRAQFIRWVKGVVAISDFVDEDRQQVFYDWLLENDPYFRNIDQLEPDIRAREEVFIGNTLRGMSEYVQSLTEEQRDNLRS
jgi:glyoxylase-like metal-dependent hydrolase (beta-lactamase superfamily II)